MSDFDGKVIGIQGTPVSNESPNVGDILKYDGSKWIPSYSVKMNSQEFLEDGYWTAPNGVNTVIITGFGGGAGGSGGWGNGSYGQAGAGGGGSIRNTSIIDVIPGTLYNITIGAGGEPGVGGNGFAIGSQNGFSTTFGSLFVALGGGRAAGHNFDSDTYRYGGPNNPHGNTTSNIPSTAGMNVSIGSGGSGSAKIPGLANEIFQGWPNEGFVGGLPGSQDTMGGSGGGGGAGPGGNGGNGGSGGAVPTDGLSAANNSGAGGGGGGGSTNNIKGGDGGKGGSGFLKISWVC